MADFCLSDAVYSSKPLFNTIWIPWQIVIDHQVGTLKIDPLTGSICREEYLNFGVMPESFLRVHPLFAAHSTMDHNNSARPAEQRRYFTFKIIQSVAVLREKHQLLRGRRRNGWQLHRALFINFLCSRGATSAVCENFTYKAGKFSPFRIGAT